MTKLIDETALELGRAIHDLDKTFKGNINWFYYKKVQVLGKILDDLIELQKEENNIKK